jgi:hypothetical protein
MLKAWLPACGNTRSWNKKKEVRSLEMCPGRGSGNPLSVSASHHHKVSSLVPPCALHHVALPHHRTPNNRAKWALTELYEPVSQSKSFLLFSWLPQILCHSNQELTNTQSSFFLFVFFFFKMGVFLCSSGWPGTHSSPGWPQTYNLSASSLPNAGIIEWYHHIQLTLSFKYINKMYLSTNSLMFFNKVL